MSRDLATEIDRSMNSQNHNIKKKTILCASRIVKRVSDLLENFLPITKTLLSDKILIILIIRIMVSNCYLHNFFVFQASFLKCLSSNYEYYLAFSKCFRETG